MVMVARTMALRTATEEDAQRGGSISREDGGESEQGEEAAHV
jgi:hypothetical protein